MKVRNRIRISRVALAACLSTLAVFALGSSPAGAARSHPFKAAFSSECANPRDVAVDEANGWVYVYCPGSHALNGGGIGMIKRFDLNGNPVPFTYTTPFQGNGYVVNYVSGNAITHVPDPANLAFAVGPVFGGTPMSMDVDNSTSGHPGFIYATPVNGARNIEIFEPSGRWVGDIPTPGNAGNPQAVGVDDQGFVYSGTNGNFGRGKMEKFNLAWKEVEQIFFDNTWTHIRPDSTHGVWAERQTSNLQEVFRFEADQYNTNLKTDGLGQTEYAIPGTFSPFAPAPLFPGTTNEPIKFDVDPDNDDLYVDTTTTIVPYAKGNAIETAHQIQPAIGTGQLTASRGIHVTTNDYIYASRSTSGGQVAVFEPGQILPKVTTNPPKLQDVGHTSVTVTGLVDPDGGTDITSCKVAYGKDTTYGSTATCIPDPNSAPPGSNFSGPTEVSAVLPGLTTGQEYHYRLTAANVSGEGLGVDRTVTPAAVLNVKTEPATEVDKESAIFNGSFNPDSISTTYKFQYGLNTAFRQETAVLGPVSGAVDLPVSTAVTGLQAGRTYHYRLMATNANGTTFGQDQVFKTPTSPRIGGVRATEVTATSATLNATINTVGYASTFHFEYGTTPDYGTSVPFPEGILAASDSDQNVSIHIEGLQPNATHHFRVVAGNELWGESQSDDTTFDFAPPACPNAHVRQQTGSNYLPDCRAYELVSPENAGSAVLFPSNEMIDFGQGFGFASNIHYQHWVQNTGLATSPSRFVFLGSLGAVPGLDPPNSVLDSYLTTRTNTGWETTLPALKGSEALTTGRHQCSVTLDQCLDHTAPDLLEYVPNLQQNAPYVFAASGKKLAQWPTNVGIIPNGTHFAGDVQPSGDFSHFAFSSRNVPFVAGGVTGAPGSAYDNDIASKSIAIISKLPNGSDIPQDPKGAGGTSEFISFSPRGVSRDGSHILMRTKAPGGAHHLYMRVDDSVTYDIARGAAAKVIGSTSDGTKVVYTTPEKLLPADTDTSVDVYMWSEAGDTVAILSQGNGQGNSDACSTAYTALCNATGMTSDRGSRGGFEGEYSVMSLPGIDSTIALQSGDSYFYSPENLDSGAAAAQNERNLYLYRNGEPNFVATLDPGTQINRLQISPDGSRAAFVTAARLTGYDNKGFRVMYTYNADTGLIRCASCNPTGAPPTADVVASEGGPFMSDDGRPFFATRDSLVPQDTDGITSVYEFVDGRPQLLSSGTGSRDFSGNGLVTAFFVPEHIGLEYVSNDGVDVIFSTYDTLVPQDENGASLKFYDARTGGGFDLHAEPAPCVAADECHGEDSSAPVVQELPSNANLGTGSNFPTAITKTRRCKKGLTRREGRCVKRHRSRRARNASRGHGHG